MPKMTGSRLVAEVFKGYGITHVFFVPTILMDALAEMDGLGVQKILTHRQPERCRCVPRPNPSA